MASLREYFDTDFNYAARVHVRLLDADFPDVEAVLLYDFAANNAFFACYVPGTDRALDFFLRLVEGTQFGKSQVALNGRVTLPSARAFPGRLMVNNVNPFEMRAQFHGDPEWISTIEIGASSRVFIYTETNLVDSEIKQLKDKARALGQLLQFRSITHALERSKFETPLAFICHDSNDKEAVARPMAISLQRLMCPVWYDEFSLAVGDNLREKIEKGLKTCKKCVLILSSNFFSNRGWTKKEFDSIFTREVLEEKQLVMPVWYGVTKQEVYAYSPSLLNVVGIDWQQLGEAEVCRRLSQAILNQEH